MSLNLAEVGKQGDQTQCSFVLCGCVLLPSRWCPQPREATPGLPRAGALAFPLALGGSRGGQRLTEPVLECTARPEPVREPHVGVFQGTWASQVAVPPGWGSSTGSRLWLKPVCQGASEVLGAHGSPVQPPSWPVQAVRSASAESKP